MPGSQCPDHSDVLLPPQKVRLTVLCQSKKQLRRVRYFKFQPQIFIVSEFLSRKEFKGLLPQNQDQFSLISLISVVLGGTPPRPLKTWSQRSWPAILLLQMFNMSPLCLPPVINIQSSKSSFSAYFLFLLYKCINICKGICKYWWNGVHCNFINKTMVPISLFIILFK